MNVKITKDSSGKPKVKFPNNKITFESGSSVSVEPEIEPSKATNVTCNEIRVKWECLRTDTKDDTDYCKGIKAVLDNLTETELRDPNRRALTQDGSLFKAGLTYVFKVSAECIKTNNETS